MNKIALFYDKRIGKNAISGCGDRLDTDFSFSFVSFLSGSTFRVNVSNLLIEKRPVSSDRSTQFV